MSNNYQCLKSQKSSGAPRLDNIPVYQISTYGQLIFSTQWSTVSVGFCLAGPAPYFPLRKTSVSLYKANNL